MREDQDVRRNMNRYLNLNFYRTEGFIDRLDAIIFREIIAGQVKHEVKGSLVEIGVHYGRSFFLLALGRTHSEKCLAIDLFEDDALHTNREGIGRFGGFRKNCRRYQYALSENEILKGSSLTLSAGEILERAGEARFFSIDGGHMYEHVMNDLRLAERVLTRQGVICLDDMFSALWPEVAAATFDWMREPSQRFVPFLATKDKLYVCDSACAPLYMSMVRERKELSARAFRSMSLFSHQVLVLLPSVTSRVADRMIGAMFSATRRVAGQFTRTGQGGSAAPFMQPLTTKK